MGGWSTRNFLSNTKVVRVQCGRRVVLFDRRGRGNGHGVYSEKWRPGTALHGPAYIDYVLIFVEGPSGVRGAGWRGALRVRRALLLARSSFPADGAVFVLSVERTE